MTLPAIDDLASVGGAINDYRPVPDPTVERAANHDNIIAANAVSATRTLTRAFASFTLGTTPALVQHDAVWGTGSGVAPVVARTGTGVWTITWPATVNDALGVSQAVNLRGPWVSYGGLGTTTFLLASVERTAPNVLTVYTLGDGGGPPVPLNFTSAVTLNVFTI